MSRNERRVTAILILLTALAQADEIDDGRALLGGPRHEEGVGLIRTRVSELEKLPATAERLRRIGVGYSYLRDDKKARKAFEGAIKLEPRNPRHHHALGLLLSSSDLEAAEAAMTEAVRLDPKAPTPHFELGDIRRQRGNYAGAFESFKKVCELDARHAGPHRNAGKALIELDRFAEAVPWLEKAIEIDPDFADAHYEAGFASYYSKQFEKAYAFWSRTAELRPADLTVHSKLIQACYAQEKYEVADRHRTNIHAVWRADEELKRRFKVFCIDEFRIAENLVYVFEPFEKKGLFYPVFTFRVISPSDDLLRTIQLEYDAASADLGVPYHVCITTGEGHRPISKLKELPSYAELKKQVIAAAKNAAKAGSSAGKKTD